MDPTQQNHNVKKTSEEEETDGSRNGRWTDEEHNLFLQGLNLHGRDWKAIAALVKTRNLVQIRTHAQKYFLKQEKNKRSNDMAFATPPPSKVRKLNEGTKSADRGVNIPPYPTRSRTSIQIQSLAPPPLQIPQMSQQQQHQQQQQQLSQQQQQQQQQLPPPINTPQIIKIDIPLSPDEDDYPNTPLSRFNNGRSELHNAIVSGNIKLIELLLADAKKNSSNINLPDSQGFTPLMLAACIADSKMSLKLCDILIQNGAHLDDRDHIGNTPLHWASAIGSSKGIQLLIEKGSDPNWVNNNKETPLHTASRYGRISVIEYLLSPAINADYKVQNIDYLTAFDVAGCPAGCVVDPLLRNMVRNCYFKCIPYFRTLVLYHNDCIKPISNGGDPNSYLNWENSDRVKVILNKLHEKFVQNEIDYTDEINLISKEQMVKVHTESYIEFLFALDKSVQDKEGYVPMTPTIQGKFGTVFPVKNSANSETQLSKETFTAARRASGAICKAIDDIVAGKHRNAFCVVRPPGHNCGLKGLAKLSSGCGYSILNHIMIGTQYCLDTYKDIKKIAIVDFDIHHGNGTEELIKKFNKSDQLLYISLHLYCKDPENKYEFYPGTGDCDDFINNIYNCPISPNWDNCVNNNDRTYYLFMFHSRVLPTLRAFKPDLILVSAGFDGGKADVGNSRSQPKYDSGMDLVPDDYMNMADELQKMANICCKGRLVNLLEGGYGHYEKPQPNQILLNRSSLAVNCSSYIHGLTGKNGPIQNNNKSSQKYCKCGENKNEYMLECSSGKVCGGWVHLSCVGLDNLTEKEARRLIDYICPFCRAEGFPVNGILSPTFSVRTPSSFHNANNNPYAELAGLAALSDEYILPSPKHDNFMSSPLVYHDTVNMSKGKSIFDSISITTENNNTNNKLTKENNVQTTLSTINPEVNSTVIQSEPEPDEKKNS